MIFCISLAWIGNYGLGNLMLLAINFVNFDDEFLDLLFRLGEEKEVKEKDGTITNIPNEEELSAIIGVDIFIMFIFSFITIFLIFPINRIVEGKFDLTPGGDKNPYRFFSINFLKIMMMIFILYIIIMAIIDYYNEHLKKEEQFKSVKSFNDLKDSCKVGIIAKIIFFSILGMCFLFHSFDTFFSGLNMPSITKRTGSILYSSSHKLFNSLHHLSISSGYSIHKGLLDEKTHSGRDVLVFKYLTETYVEEEIKEKQKPKGRGKEKVDLTNLINELNQTNSSKLKNNSNKSDNNTKNKTLFDDNNKTNKTKNNTRWRKKEEWKTIQFQHQINEKTKKNNLYFFMSLLFRQPRLEYALHRLAYEGKNKMEDFNEKLWIPHLIYRLFNDKTFVENITKIKIEKIRYYFSKYSDNHFRTSFISRYLDDTNLTQIEEYLKKHNSLIINKEIKKNILGKIPFPAIMYTLTFILIMRKIVPTFL